MPRVLSAIRAALTPTLVSAIALSACGTASTSSNHAASHDSTQTSTAANAVDRAFVRQMIPHHKIAVQMAETALAQTRRQTIKGLASAIVSTQDREIAELTGIAKKLGVMSRTMPEHAAMSDDMMADDETLGLSMQDPGMDMNRDTLDGAKPFDRMFIDMMVPHHQGAIRMARAELANGSTRNCVRSPARSSTAKRTRFAR